MLFSPDSQVQQAGRLSNQRHYLESEKILKSVDPHKTNIDIYNFFKLINNFAMNNKKEAQKYLNQINQSFTSEMMPERYKTLTGLMANEMKEWKDDFDDLGDIARDMKKVQDRLHSADAGKKVRKTQKEIVDRLDKMIKEMEDKANKQSESQSSDGQNGKQSRAANPQSPQKDSEIDNQGGTGAVQHRHWRKTMERWGNLPERERARAIQDMVREMPPRYRTAVENYFRNISQPVRR